MSNESLWSDQSSEQDSTPGPILETTLLGGADDHVIVKLLTTNNTTSSNGSEVLTKLLTGSSSPAAINVGTTILLTSNVQSQGLRKIEPKPSDSGEVIEKVEADNDSNPYGRLLGINATRRGVKTCPLCMKKIGYRSKQCKFCSPSKQRKRSRKSQQNKESSNDEEKDTVQVELDTTNVNVVVMESETEIATSEILNAAEDASKQVLEDSEPATTASYEEECQQNIASVVDGVESETASQDDSEQVIGKKNYHTSLQDLIHTLLVQNQNSSVYIAPDHQVEADKLNMEQQNCDPQEEQDGDEEIEQQQEQTQVTTGPVGNPENAYDANSVALFLGHLAQQNGKKIRTALNPVSDNTQPGTSSSSLIGVKTKHIVIEDDMSSQAKYRKIRPKSFDEGQAVIEIPSSVASAVEEDMADSVVEVKPTDSQLRMLPGNATRRGVMPCQKCQCLIGCRSKVCKHCKFLLNESNPPFKRNRKHLRQAIQLHIPSNSTVSVFSVRRSKAGPDHRCFVWCEKNDPENRMRDVYSCDYPPCVTARELGNKPMSFLCEHAKISRTQGSTNNSTVLELNEEKLSSEFWTEEVCNSLRELNRQCNSKSVPLVQGVSDRTFVVVDQLHTDQGSSLAADLIGFVHVRFERTKVSGCWQTQVFCSGRPCTAWNPVFSCVTNKDTSLPTVLRSVNCIHYSACLWGIISDEKLVQEFKPYLEGAKAKINSDVP